MYFSRLQSKFLLTLFFGVLLLSCSPLKKFSNSAKHWENEIAAFEKLDKTETYPDSSILFTGSSSIRLWKTIQEDIYPYSAIQRGFGGSKFSDLAWYAPRIINPHRFNATVIFVANDVTGSADDKEPAEIVKLAKIVVKAAQKQSNGKPVFLVEITPTSSRWKQWTKIKEVNSALEKYAKQTKGIYFIKTSDKYLNESGRPKDELFLKDQLHLNREGYRIWGATIKENLDKVLNNK